MTLPRRSRNRALMHFLVLPTMLLSVALLGGVRVEAESHKFIFITPPIITLVLSALLLLLFVRAHLIEIGSWVGADLPMLANLANGLILLSLFFASAQAFNSILPEAGLLHWLFSFCFLWTLWNNQFSYFDVRRLLRSITALFATAFLLKYVVLANLISKDEGLVKRFAGALFREVVPLSLGGGALAPASGYIAFFTLALYCGGLLLLRPSAFEGVDEVETISLVQHSQQRALSPTGAHPSVEEHLSRQRIEENADEIRGDLSGE